MSEPETLPKPDLFLTLGAPHEPIKMTYGLLMDLQRLLPNPEAAMELVLTDPYTQDYVVRRVMTPSKATINEMADLVSAEEVDLSPDQVENLLTWVVKHVLHFFAQRVRRMAEAGESFKTALPNLFTRGSPDSTSPTPPAGPSE